MVVDSLANVLASGRCGGQRIWIKCLVMMCVCVCDVWLVESEQYTMSICGSAIPEILLAQRL